MPGEDRTSRPRARLAGAEVAARARDELAAITGLEPEGVTSLKQQTDGTWAITVELLELARIPQTDDLLGSYDAQFDEDGGILGYRRVRRYPRGRAS